MKNFTLLGITVFSLFAAQADAQVVYTNHSLTPALVTVNGTDFPGVQTYSIIGSRDTLFASPSFRFGGSADGAGVLKKSDGTYMLVVNHEDNFAVSRVLLDSTFKPVTGEYLMNSNAGMWRLCSATLATPEEHGFGPAFLTCGESGIESMTHIVNVFGQPVVDSTTSANTTLASGIGRWSGENAVPLPVATYGKTIVILGDDDSGNNGGQLVMYVADAVGDFQNGKVYVLRRTDLSQRERDNAPGYVYNVEFVEIPNAAGMTGSQLDQYASATLSSIEFQRVEDIDYRKGSVQAGREIYFNATGAATADSVDRTVWGRVYRLVLDSNNYLTGTIECVIDGDDKSNSNPWRVLYQPDNIVVTEDYVYVQEDPNGYSFPSALPHVHDARIYQYDIQTGGMKTLLEMNHHRSAADSAIYNRNSAGTAHQNSNIGSWEFGAMIDLSQTTGIENSFALCVQPHTWRYPEFSGVDGGTLRPSEKQGSQVITLTNIPRVQVNAPVTANDTVCTGSAAVLSAWGGTTFWSTNGTEYRWYTNATGGTPFYTGATYTTAALSSTTTYYVETFASSTASSTRTPVTATATPIPATPVITQNNNILTSSAASGNQWFRNGVLIPGATNQNYTVTIDGYYSVTATVSGCASQVSGEVFMNVTGINESELLNSISAYPNPNGGSFTIDFRSDVNSSVIVVSITNANGQQVFHKTVERFNGRYTEQVDMSTFADGIYIINITAGKQLFQQRITKQQ